MKWIYFSINQSHIPVYGVLGKIDNFATTKKDISSGDTVPHDERLRVNNEDVFDLELIVFNDATKNENVTNMNAVDLSLRLMMGRMRAVYLHRFVMDLLVSINCSPIL